LQGKRGGWGVVHQAGARSEQPLHLVRRLPAEALLVSLRPRQWVKNLFVVAPIVFAKHLTHPSVIKAGVGAFGVFCLLAGAVYTLNGMAARWFQADAGVPGVASRHQTKSLPNQDNIKSSNFFASRAARGQRWPRTISARPTNANRNARRAQASWRMFDRHRVVRPQRRRLSD